MKSTNGSAKAFTLIELFVTIVVIVILAAMLLPAMQRPKAGGPRINCINNLKQIGIAFRIWAVDSQAPRFPMHASTTNGGTMELAAEGNAYIHFQAMSNELSIPKLLKCPTDKARVCATNFTTDFSNQKVSYFVGLDAPDEIPGAFLSGDRNVTNAFGIKGRIPTLTTNVAAGWSGALHEAQGNICFADGSVQGLSTPGLQKALLSSGLVTNRLAIP